MTPFDTGSHDVCSSIGLEGFGGIAFPSEQEHDETGSVSLRPSGLYPSVTVVDNDLYVNNMGYIMATNTVHGDTEIVYNKVTLYVYPLG